MKKHVLLFVTIVAMTSSYMSCHSETATSQSGDRTTATSPVATSPTSTPAPTPENSPLNKLKNDDPLPANLFVELAKKVNPIVVNISTSIRPRRMQPQNPFGGGRDPFWEFFEEFMGPQGQGPRGQDPRGQQQARPAQSIGTGFVIESDGLILTNNHVVDAADEIKVQFSNEPDKFYTAEVVGADPRSDVALIKINVDRKLPVAEFGSSGQVQVGEWVAAFGNPYGHTFSMSKGIISAISRKIRELNSVPFLQTDASINPGNSGGPLVDIHGRVIGINSAIDARAQGIGFAIPIDHVKQVIPQLKGRGRVAYGYLGVEMSEITPRAAHVLGLPNMEGTLITGVEQNGPADKSGIKPYDVILEFNKIKIKVPQDFLDGVQDAKIGDKVPVVVLREGKKVNLTAQVGARPEENSRLAMRRGMAPAPSAKDAPFKMGFRVADYSQKLAQDLGLKPGGPQGPLVVEVAQGSSASANGLRPGDTILDVNRVKVKTAQEVIKNLKTGTNVLRVSQAGRISLVFIEVE